jgi:hypothetical protein
MAPEQTLRRVAVEFERRLDHLADLMARRHREDFEKLDDFDAPELWEEFRRIVRESRRVQASYLTRDMALPAVCPEPDVDAARLAATGGLSLAETLRSYRIGHAVTFDVWVDALESLHLHETDHAACLRAISRFTNIYHERIADLVGFEYEREHDAISRHPDKKRLKLVRDVIDGSTDSLNGLEYDLRFEHLGAIAWGPQAHAVLADLALALDRRLLLVPAEEQLVLAWLGREERPVGEDLKALRGFKPTADAQIAVGNPGEGVAGFRRTHRQAGEAHVVAKRRPQPLTLYSDVALEAFALRDEPAAREFVAHALRTLSANGERGNLIDTLRAYFTAGQNASSAAAALGVHEHTVARRIHKVEQRLGCSLNQRRGELELALRLEPLLRQT